MSEKSDLVSLYLSEKNAAQRRASELEFGLIMERQEWARLALDLERQRQLAFHLEQEVKRALALGEEAHALGVAAERVLHLWLAAEDLVARAVAANDQQARTQACQAIVQARKLAAAATRDLLRGKWPGGPLDESKGG